MKLFLRKYLKAPMALLVCLVMVLQMLPAPQPAQAGFWDVIKKIVSRIPTPPNITFTNENGNLYNPLAEAKSVAKSARSVTFCNKFWGRVFRRDIGPLALDKCLGCC